MSAVAMLGVTNLLTPLSYASAATKYHALTSSHLENNPLIFEMPDEDVSLYAHTAANRYYVEYSGHGGAGSMASGTFYYDTTGYLATGTYENLGHTFSGWNTDPNGGGTAYADKAKVRNWTGAEEVTIPIYAQWNANHYKIDYDLNKGSGSSTPQSGASHPTGATYGESFEVSNPTRTGYNFSGWTITGMDSNPHIIGGVSSSETTTGGVTGTGFNNLHAEDDATVYFAARWNPKQVPYTVEHYLENLSGDYVIQTGDTQHLEGTADTEVKPATGTYTGFTPNADTPYSGNISPEEDTVFTYHYDRNSYNLTLRAGTGVAQVKGTGTVNTSGISTDSSDTKQFKFEEPVVLSFELKSGYTGGYWSGDKGNVSSFVMPASNVEQTAYANTILYKITVNLLSGYVASPIQTGYTVEDTVNYTERPERLHSQFAGWTGTAIVGTAANISISVGSTGDRYYTATWTCDQGFTGQLDGKACIPDTVQYRVRHVRQDLGGDYDPTNTGLVEYDYLTGKTEDLTEATYRTYEGFTGNGIEQVQISGDSSTRVDIGYVRLAYTGTINKPDGITTATASGAHSAGTTYKFEDTVTLTATTGAGYTFSGWKVTRNDNGAPVTVTDPTSMDGATFKMPAVEVTITPEVTAHPYDLIIIKNGGTGGTDTRTYTVEDVITLEAPSRDANSVFLGWSGTDIDGVTGTVTINHQIGDRTYEAVWGCRDGYHTSGATECAPNQYTITVDYDDGGDTPTTGYTFTYGDTDPIEIPNPVQSGYTFSGWIISGLSGNEATADGDPLTAPTDTSTGTTFVNLTPESGGTVYFVADWIENNDTLYKVYHYYQNTGDDKYELSGTYVEYSGTTNHPVNLNSVMENTLGFHNSLGSGRNDAYTGGDANGPAGTPKTEITIDKHGDTVIYFYYDRNLRNVFLTGDANVATLSGAGLYKYGADVRVEATAKPGYHFVNWTGSPAPSGS